MKKRSGLNHFSQIEMNKIFNLNSECLEVWCNWQKVLFALFASILFSLNYSEKLSDCSLLKNKRLFKCFCLLFCGVLFKWSKNKSMLIYVYYYFCFYLFICWFINQFNYLFCDCGFPLLRQEFLICFYYFCSMLKGATGRGPSTCDLETRTKEAWSSSAWLKYTQGRPQGRWFLWGLSSATRTTLTQNGARRWVRALRPSAQLIARRISWKR